MTAYQLDPYKSSCSRVLNVVYFKMTSSFGFGMKDPMPRMKKDKMRFFPFFFFFFFNLCLPLTHQHQGVCCWPAAASRFDFLHLRVNHLHSVEMAHSLDPVCR